MLEDPRVNFAISTRGHATGANHFGFQAENAEELHGLKQLAQAASGGQVLDQGETACCYARSEKHWTVDPQGLAWEHFHTMSDVQEFGADMANQTGACCIPLKSSAHDGGQAKGACCIPKTAATVVGSCCN